MLAIAKLIFTTVLALGSLAGFVWLRGRDDERLWRTITITGLIVKLLAILAIYLIAPQINQTSDANHFYLTQTQFFLDGNLPYRDYHSSYSPLFPVLLAPFVKLWPSVSMVVLVMVGLDLLLLGLYLWRGRVQGDSTRWQVAYLYTFSPLVVYWTMFTGYNSVIIALFGLLGLVLAEREQQVWSGVAAAFGFLFSKLLMVLMWPAIVFYGLKGWFRRAIPLGALVLLLLGLYGAGWNVLEPIQAESWQHTSGNLIFLLIPLFPRLAETIWWNLLPPLLFGLGFLALFVLYSRVLKQQPEGNFDNAAAFSAIVCLLFMIVSKKTFTFYLPMLTIFLIHAVSRHPKILNRALLPFTFLGMVTTIEPYLFQYVGEPKVSLLSNGFYLLLLILDLLVVVSYGYLLVLCYQTMGLRQQKSEASHLA